MEFDRRQIIVVFIGLMAGMVLSGLDGNIVGVALPTIVGDLGGLSHIAWVGTSYLLTSTAATPLFGKLSDLYGRLRLFQVAIVTFVVGSLLCGVAHSMTQLVAARGLQGIGGGGLLAMAYVIMGDVVPPRDRGRYSGMITAVFALCSVAGPLIGGFFIDHLTWRWIFTINTPVGIVSLFVVSRSLRLPFTKHSHSVDWLGSGLLVSSVSAVLILAATWVGEGGGWNQSTVMVAGGLAIVLGATFIWWEGKASEPIIPLRLFRNPVVAVIVPMMVLFGTLIFGANSFMPVYLQAVDGVSATKSGLLLVPLMAGVTVASISTGRMTSITGRYKHWPILGCLFAVSGCIVLSQMSVGSSKLVSSTGMLLMGLGMGMTFPTSTLAVQNSVEPKDMGIASSMVTFFRSLGGAIGLAIYGAVFTSRITRSGLDPALFAAPEKIKDLAPAVHDNVIAVLGDAVTFLFAISIPVVLCALGVSVFLKELPLRRTSSLTTESAIAH